MVDLKQIKVLAWDIGGTVFNWRGTIQKELEAIARHQEKELDVFRFASEWRYGMFDMLAKVRSGEIPRMNADEIHRKVLDDVIDSSDILTLSKSSLLISPTIKSSDNSSSICFQGTSTVSK